MRGNLLIAQAGGPSCALNATLKGVIKEALKHEEIYKIYGAIGGAGGILDENFVDLGSQSERFLQLLPGTPASVIGTSRRPLLEEDFEKIATVLEKNNIKYLLYNGGNGSMATCDKLYRLLKGKVNVIGVPKTIDNDIEETDHSPGYGSAARYMAITTGEIAEDIKSMPIHVCIVEAMGRNAGWIAAASTLIKKSEDGAPHLVYVPEKAFNEEKFLTDVEKLFKKHGGVVVVVSEGITNEKGQPVVPPLIVAGAKDPYPGDVGVYLANLIWEKLGIKARSEKPGIALRASATLQSTLDIKESIDIGAFAVKSAVEGKTGYMAAIKRISNSPYTTGEFLISLNKVAALEKKLPDCFINEEGNGITAAFTDYCKPLVGELPEYAELKL